MHEVSVLRLNILRAMYLFIAMGLGITIWPEIIFFNGGQADSDTVIYALLGTLAVLSLVGVRYPLQMLPVLLFELIWKLIWAVAFALRMWLNNGLDEYAAEVLAACAIGLVLVPLAIPWGYVIKKYFKAPGEPWRTASQVST